MPNPSSSSPVIWTRLDEQGVLLVEGPDAGKFLQGQATCDVLGLAPDALTLGAFCNAQGRTRAVFRLFRDHDRHFLLLGKELLEPIRKRLQIYVLRSRVDLREVSPAWCVSGLVDRSGNAVWASPDYAFPAEAGRYVRLGERGYLLRLPARLDRYLLVAESEAAERFERELHTRGVQAGTCGDWDLAEIADGIPRVTAATSEEFVPQMLNLDLLGGISFTKGCYTGQEVVARTHYLGTVKRRMYRLEVHVERLPEPGAKLYGATGESAVGQVVAATASGIARCELLAVIGTEAAQGGEIHLDTPAGPAAEILPLPYGRESAVASGV